MPRKRRTPHPQTPQSPRPHPPRPPRVPPTRRATVADAFGHSNVSAAAGPHSVAGGSAALDLTAPASAGLADVILDIAGADHAALRSALTAWQREQDRVLNRAWRRPGGLVRPADL